MLSNFAVQIVLVTAGGAFVAYCLTEIARGFGRD